MPLPSAAGEVVHGGSLLHCYLCQNLMTLPTAALPALDLYVSDVKSSNRSDHHQFGEFPE